MGQGNLEPSPHLDHREPAKRTGPSSSRTGPLLSPRSDHVCLSKWQLPSPLKKRVLAESGYDRAQPEPHALTLLARMGSDFGHLFPAFSQRQMLPLPIGVWASMAPTQAAVPGSPAPWQGPVSGLAQPAPASPSPSLLQTSELWLLGRQTSEPSAVGPRTPGWNRVAWGPTGTGHVAQVPAPVTPVSVANLKEAEAHVATTGVLVDSLGVELALKISQAHP